MQMLRSRRSFLASLSLAGAASLLDRGDSLAQERPPEITTVRIPTGSLICNAPTYIADELLRAEGFTDIQHVPVTPERSAGPPEPMERGELDFGMVYTPPMVAAIEAKVMPLLREGRVKPLMDSTFPLEKAADAHRRMETSEHIGKIVLAAER